MNKQFTVAGVTFQENHWVNGEEDTILLSPFQYAALESLLYVLLKDSLHNVQKGDNTKGTDK